MSLGTRSPRWWRRPRTVEHGGRSFRIDRSVFDPERHLSGLALAHHVLDVVDPGSSVLEIGTGCGILAATLAGRLQAPTTGRVVATDVNAAAVACARANLAGLDVDVRLGDLFDPIASGERFDVVLTNPPYEIGRHRDVSLGSPDFLVRFAESVFDHGDRVVLAYPADDAARLAATLEPTALSLTMERRIATAGRDLGVFVGSNTQSLGSASPLLEQRE